MINKIQSFLIFLIIILPISLISGPAIPDLTITFSGLFFLILIIYKKDLRILTENKFFIISSFFWIYLLLISTNAENRYLSFRDALIFIRILFIPILILYIASLDRKYIEKIIMVIFASVIFVSIDSFYQYMNYQPEYGFRADLLGFKSDWYGRLTGPFGDELIPGAYLSKLSLLGLIFIFMKVKNILKLNIYSISYLSIVGLIIFASGERMALATYLMSLIFLIIFYKGKRLIFLFSFLLTIALSFIAKNNHPYYNDYKILESTPYHLGLKIEKNFKCKKNTNLQCQKIINLQPEFKEVILNFDKSAYGEIYKLASKMFKDHKYFGIGLNNFTYLCNNDFRYKNRMQNYSCVSHPHNIYLQWLVEAGIFGLIFFIIYLLSISISIYKRNYNEFSLISLATLLILFWPIMSTGSLLKNWNGVSTFFIIGICLSLSRLYKKIN